MDAGRARNGNATTLGLDITIWVFHIDPLWGTVAVMAAGMSVGISVFVIAQKYQEGVAVISTAILLSTVVAVVTHSLLLALFL